MTTAFVHVGGKNLKDAHMLLKLKFSDSAVVGILESALLHDPMAVEQMIEKGGLGDVPGHDKRWVTLLSSLHTLGNQTLTGDRADFLPFFQHWWDTYYPSFSERDLEDLTVYGSSCHAGEFDGLPNIHIDY